MAIRQHSPTFSSHPSNSQYKLNFSGYVLVQKRLSQRVLEGGNIAAHAVKTTFAQAQISTPNEDGLLFEYRFRTDRFLLQTNVGLGRGLEDLASGPGVNMDTKEPKDTDMASPPGTFQAQGPSSSTEPSVQGETSLMTTATDTTESAPSTTVQPQQQGSLASMSTLVAEVPTQSSTTSIIDSATLDSTMDHTNTQTIPEEATEARTGSGTRKTRKTANDGYIYQSYDEYRHISNDQDGDESTKSSSTSAMRILELRGLERRIVQLLETAGKAIQILSGDDDEDDNNEDNNNNNNNNNENEMDPQAVQAKAIAKTAKHEEEGRRLLAATSLSMDDRKAMVEEYADERSAKFEAYSTAYVKLVDEIQQGMRRQFRYLTKAGISSSQVPFKNVVYGEEKELDTWLNAVDVLRESTDALIGNIEWSLLQDPKTREELEGQSSRENISEHDGAVKVEAK
ncbi:hypothetical protein BGW38_007592 [Lunasporangiospora selenospora]|uniref:Uncharacterized protein n=1 Tax=Lunasporangiospora selenospora TaxID=979761 RepID=A0A9P6KGR3_9FUNG|nr:hypothetical protein BGW38_007592 [Lunasporangiospora selenospora]